MRGIVPGKFVQWFRKLLQPAVVREATIPQIWIRPKEHLDILRRLGTAASGLGPRWKVRCLESDFARRKGGAFDQPVMKRLPPASLKIRPEVLAPPIATHDLIITPNRLLLHHCAEKLMRGFSVRKRRNQRLNH